MAKGRKRKPTATKILAGNPGKGKLNEHEPTPDLILPPAPDGLNEVGKAKWDEVALRLYNQSILTELDTDLLFILCKSWQKYIEAETMVDKFGGPVIKTDKGNPIQNPYVSIANQNLEKVMKILSLFGMSPVDRSKVTTVQKAKPKSLAEKFFNAPVAAETARKK